MKKKHIFLRLLLLLVLISGLAAVFVFRDAILLRIAPKTVLSGAVSRLYGQLEERFSGSPIALLLPVYDAQGRYTIQLEADTANPILGEIRLDMTVDTDGTAHRLQAQGTASTSASDLDVILYMDSDALAVSSQELVNGDWYGITYDSFSQDIRSIPLLHYVLSDRTVRSWNQSLQSIRDEMQKTITGPDLPALSGQEFQLLLAGLMLLPGKGTQDQIRVDGLMTDCFRIDYTADSQQLGGLLPQEDAVLAASFYLLDKTLIQADFYYTAGTDRINGQVVFGKAPGTDPLTLTLKKTENGSFTETAVTVWTEHREGEYQETWNITRNGTASTAAYTWNEVSGNLNFSLNGATPTAWNLSQRETGLRVYTEALDSLQNCTMTIQKGSGLSQPEYKNLDQWSLEDFWKLLGGIGALFGLQAE